MDNIIIVVVFGFTMLCTVAYVFMEAMKHARQRGERNAEEMREREESYGHDGDGEPKP